MLCSHLRLLRSQDTDHQYHVCLDPSDCTQSKPNVAPKGKQNNMPRPPHTCTFSARHGSQGLTMSPHPHFAGMWRACTAAEGIAASPYDGCMFLQSPANSTCLLRHHIALKEGGISRRVSPQLC